MKRIKLTQGKYALVDNADFEWLNSFKWTANLHGRTWRVRRTSTKLERKKYRRNGITMHRLIMGIMGKKGLEVDHIDGNNLNNQRKNLRLCNHAENSKNRTLNKNTKTGYKGVTEYPWHKYKKFIARITIDKKLITLGYFTTKEEAHRVYEIASIKYHGKFKRRI